MGALYPMAAVVGMQKEIKFNAVDCFKQASFQRSALGALLVPLLENNPEGIALADTSVSILQSAIASMIGLIADGVENGDGVEEVRKKSDRRKPSHDRFSCGIRALRK